MNDHHNVTLAKRGVLLDWRGTLVVAPTLPWLVATALQRLGRAETPDRVAAIVGQLQAADHSLVDSSAIDVDIELHAAAHRQWFADAGIDGELSHTLYAVESDPFLNPFADDVGPLLRFLHGAGVRLGIVSDIHVDLRPVFAHQRNPDGTTWAELIDVWVLSFEVGCAKPDPVIFMLALERLGLPAHDVLMVGDRGGWDGAAVDLGITTLLVPALQSVQHRRLQQVADLVAPTRHDAANL